MIRDYANHAANERTFLAWVRTGIAIIALGFVIEKFNLFLLTVAKTLAAEAPYPIQMQKLSGPVGRFGGLALILGGVALIALSASRFIRTRRLLAADETFPPVPFAWSSRCSWRRCCSSPASASMRRSVKPSWRLGGGVLGAAHLWPALCSEPAKYIEARGRASIGPPLGARHRGLHEYSSDRIGWTRARHRQCLGPQPQAQTIVRRAGQSGHRAARRIGRPRCGRSSRGRRILPPKRRGSRRRWARTAADRRHRRRPRGAKHSRLRANPGGGAARRLQGLHQGSVPRPPHSHRRLWPLRQ